LKISEGRISFLASFLRLGVQEEDDSGSVGGVSCCWAKGGRTGGKAESAGPAARVNGEGG
jgi:hypothetical protein